MTDTRVERFDIVIAGASFAGLALARALGAGVGTGLRIAIVDRAPALAGPRAPDSRAFALSASSKRMLDALGVWGSVASEAQPITRIELTDSPLDAGIRPVLLTYDNEVARGEPASYVVPNAVLTEALRADAAAMAGVFLILGAEARDFTASGTGVEVALGDGRKLDAALLIAADGRRSRLRDIAGIKCVTWTTQQTGIVTTVAHERPHGGVAVQHFLPGGPFAMLPLRGHRMCLTWSEDAAEARRILAGDDAAFTREIERRFGGKLGWVRLDGPRQSWPLDQSLARSLIAPRFALAGDAAHAVHPIAGQGLNLALRDAAALAEVLADGARLGLDLGGATLLARYARWRRFDSVVSTFAYSGLDRLFSGDGTLVRAGRDMGLKLVDGLPGLKALLVREAAGLTGELPKLLRGEMV